MQIPFKGTNGNNFWSGRDGQPAYAIVDHIMSKSADGVRATLESCWSWFSSPKSEVSAHFGISKDGRVWQFVRLSDTAWANGNLENPDLTIDWLAECVDRKINPNRRTISIEHEGDSADQMPEAQYQASLALHRFLVATAGIKPDRKHIIGHYQISSRTRANCPGTGFPWGRLMSDLRPASSFTDPITGFQVIEPFASFWKKNGGLEIFGRPITSTQPGGTGFPESSLVQWFERARFELHAGGVVMLGLVGAEALKSGR